MRMAILHYYLLPHEIQVADVVLETRFPQTELIPQSLQLGRQLLLILHSLFELGSEALVLLRQLSDDGGLLPLRQLHVHGLLLQGSAEAVHVALELRHFGLVLPFHGVQLPAEDVLFLLQDLERYTNVCECQSFIHTTQGNFLDTLSSRYLMLHGLEMFQFRQSYGGNARISL